MNFAVLVKNNKQIIEFVNNWPGKDQPFHIKKKLLLTKYVGTLDIASSRFNTILLRLSENPLLKDEFSKDVENCNKILRKFFRFTLRIRTWPKALLPFVKWQLHRIGTKDIPKIRLTLKQIENSINV